MDINLFTWHTDRCLDFCPKHFVLVKIPLTDDAKLWITNRLSGRYYVGSLNTEENALFSLLDANVYAYFEDPQEAVLFQLTWS